jgi:hypothetical protein
MNRDHQICTSISIQAASITSILEPHRFELEFVEGTFALVVFCELLRVAKHGAVVAVTLELAQISYT